MLSRCIKRRSRTHSDGTLCSYNRIALLRRLRRGFYMCSAYTSKSSHSFSKIDFTPRLHYIEKFRASPTKPFSSGVLKVENYLSFDISLFSKRCRTILQVLTDIILGFRISTSLLCVQISILRILRSTLR